MRDLLARLDGLRERLREIPQADERRLQELRNEILGRKNGALTEILKALPALDARAFSPQGVLNPWTSSTGKPCRPTITKRSASIFISSKR